MKQISDTELHQFPVIAQIIRDGKIPSLELCAEYNGYASVDEWLNADENMEESPVPESMRHLIPSWHRYSADNI